MKQNIRIESAGLPDIPQIMQIIEEACQKIENPDWYSVDDQAFMEAHIERNGFILKAVASGEESMDEIAGFLVVRFPGNAADNLGKYLALPEEEMERVAHMESAAVRSAYRGLGLQNQLMQYAEKMLEGTPYIHLLGTAHPDNCYSVRNFERLGYAVIAEDRKYGGLLRHVFYKKREIPVRALVFDLDGLLFDSERIVQRSWEDVGNELGIPHMGNHIYHTLGMNLAGRNAYFSKAIGEDFPHEEFARRTRIRFREIVDAEGLPVKPGALELLEYAKKAGYHMAVATSARKEYALRNLREADILKYFEGFVFGDVVTRAKPDPEIYLKACESIHMLPEQCVALEDAPAGIRAAKAAGLKPVMIPDMVEPTEEILELTYRRYDSLFDVIEILGTGFF